MTSYWAGEEKLVERADVEGAAELTLSLFTEPHVRDVLRPSSRTSSNGSSFRS